MIFGFDDARAESRERARNAEQNNPKGVQPVPGGIYTVSPDFVCGDRSYTQHILSVIDVNDSVAVCEILEGHTYGDKTSYILPINERYWYDASGLMVGVRMLNAISKKSKSSPSIKGVYRK